MGFGGKVEIIELTRYGRKKHPKMQIPGDRDDTENKILLGTHRNLGISYGFECKSWGWNKYDHYFKIQRSSTEISATVLHKVVGRMIHNRIHLFSFLKRSGKTVCYIDGSCHVTISTCLGFSLDWAPPNVPSTVSLNPSGHLAVKVI